MPATSFLKIYWLYNVCTDARFSAPAGAVRASVQCCITLSRRKVNPPHFRIAQPVKKLHINYRISLLCLKTAGKKLAQRQPILSKILLAIQNFLLLHPDTQTQKLDGMQPHPSYKTWLLAEYQKIK